MISNDRARRIATRWAQLVSQDSEIARLSCAEVVGDAPLLVRQLEACYRAHQRDSPWNDLVELVALIDWSRHVARALLGAAATPDRLAWISEAGETAAAERQARYQETACARRPAEEHPDA